MHAFEEDARDKLEELFDAHELVVSCGVVFLLGVGEQTCFNHDFDFVMLVQKRCNEVFFVFRFIQLRNEVLECIDQTSNKSILLLF